MKTNNETVEQVADKVFKRIQMSRERDNECGHLWTENELNIRRVLEDNAEDYCTRFLAAHKREIAVKDGERNGLLKANESLAADNTRLRGEIAEKDAEIEKLKFDNMVLKSGQRAAGEVIIEQTNKVEAKDAEIAALRALVKEMADDLSGYLCDSECNGSCASFGHCCNQTSRKIVAKAREVCNA